MRLWHLLKKLKIVRITLWIDLKQSYKAKSGVKYLFTTYELVGAIIILITNVYK